MLLSTNVVGHIIVVNILRVEESSAIHLIKIVKCINIGKALPVFSLKVRAGVQTQLLLMLPYQFRKTQKF